jgi:peptide/nickel transport system substrate-binding protein
MRLRSPRAALAALPALALVACGGSDAERSAPAGATGGTVIIAAPAEADLLLPPLVATIAGKQVVDLVFDHLAEIGDSLNTVGDAGFQPRLAQRWEWAPDSLSVAFHVDPRARWHDGRPVRAADVRFSFDLIRDPKVGSPHVATIAGIDSITVRDSLTAVAWFPRRGPESFFTVAYNLAILPEHLLKDTPRGELRSSAFARQPVGSGRFRFSRWESGQRVELVADTANYRGRPKLDRVVWVTAPDPAAAAARVLSGEADFIEVLRGDAARRAATMPNVRPTAYGSLDYGYLLFNFRAPTGSAPHPLFAERAVRAAISHAVDRAAVVKSALDTLGLVSIGPVTRAQSTADTTVRQLGFDRARAAALLDSLGWRLPAGAAGEKAVRVRGGRELAFSVIVPSVSSTRMQMAVLLQAQLAEVGVKMTIDALEPGAYIERLTSGKFDAALQTWRTDPSPSTVRQAWGSAGFPEKGGANYGRYAGRAFDAYVDSAAAEMDVARSRALYRNAYQAIVDDAPAVWLYEPRNLAAAHARLRLTGVRPDAWWAGLAEWSIPANARIARDRAGVAAKPVAAR